MAIASAPVASPLHLLGLTQPSSTGIIQDVISGLILFVISWALKYLRSSAEEARKLGESFKEHTASDKQNFKELRKYARKAQRSAIDASATAAQLAESVSSKL